MVLVTQSPLLLHSGKNMLPMQQGTTIHSSSCKQEAEMRILTLRTPQMHYSGLSFEVPSCPHSPWSLAMRTHIGHRVEPVGGFWCITSSSKAA